MKHIIKSIAEKHLSTTEMQEKEWRLSFVSDAPFEAVIRKHRKDTDDGCGAQVFFRDDAMLINGSDGLNARLSLAELQRISLLYEELIDFYHDDTLQYKVAEQAAGRLCREVDTVKDLLAAMDNLPAGVTITLAGYEDVGFTAEESDDRMITFYLGEQQLTTVDPSTTVVVWGAQANRPYFSLGIGHMGEDSYLHLQFMFEPMSGAEIKKLLISYADDLLEGETKQ